MSFETSAPPIIGLTGRIGAGKDSVAAILATHCGARVLAFADALREEVAMAWGVDPRQFRTRHTKELPTATLALQRCLDADFARTLNALRALQGLPDLDPDAPRSPRWIMQHWGTEYRRSSDPGYWGKQLAGQLARMRQLAGLTPIVITDVRFDNEASLVRDYLGGVLWRVERPGHHGGEGAEAAAHASEAEVTLPMHATISNSATPQHLQYLVLQAWHELVQERAA